MHWRRISWRSMTSPTMRASHGVLESAPSITDPGIKLAELRNWLDSRCFVNNAPRSILAAVSVLSLTGCVSTILAHKVVAPPNKSGIKPLFSDLGHPQARARGIRGDLDRSDRGRRARTSRWPPSSPATTPSTTICSLATRRARRPHIDHFRASWRNGKGCRAVSAAAKGTVILLHGFLQNRNSVTPWAIRLAQAGYRCAVLDLRGHGRIDRQTHFFRRVRGARCLGGDRRSRAPRLGCVARGSARRVVRRIGGAAHRGT